MEYEEIISEVRKIINAHFCDKIYTPKVNGNAGVFITLKKNKKLRGCIGLISPNDLKENLKIASIGVLSDPRFPKVTKEEFKNIKIEVSLLTPPQKINKPLKEIKVGEDGLIIQKGKFSGILLPHVAIEFKMDLETFLRATAKKAGLKQDDWKTADLFKFQTTIISEEI